ncbi:MAG TPA: cysteine--tRNA ligase, partial [Geminicoccaceae bacterium]|nr:cysteine--tRNA ligase [Geminicoccus sp.]HMU51292.1 cysteine--tRNA ligase [Geminicoccaceae bacterium]
MGLKLYNTLTRKKESFQPIDPANVRMYVCGPTVYQRIHIGNARPLIVFDVLFRLLRHLYGEQHVTYVRNITDIDDKIIAQAEKNSESIESLTERTTRDFLADADALGCLRPTHQPRATEHIPGMVAMIGKLIEQGHAYAADGHVLFNVPSMPAYGRLSGRNRDDQIAGARVEVAPYKRDPADFVLWKPSTPNQPGWDSPWGRGRPGWHIECSAMSEHFLGAPFDIHGGGLDLIFPHHENEIAQSCCVHDIDRMANYW